MSYYLCCGNEVQEQSTSMNIVENQFNPKGDTFLLYSQIFSLGDYKMNSQNEMHEAWKKYRSGQVKAVIVLIVGILLLLSRSGTIILELLGGFLLSTGIFLWLQLDKPKPPPHGNAPSPPCPTCSTPLIWYPDAERYYCTKCIRWYSSTEKAFENV